jgi:hypothetical protein
MTAAGAGASLASLVLHYTDKGNDAFGCTSQTLQMSGKFNTNKQCTREMAACNFLPKYARGSDRTNASVACNETVSLPNFYVKLTADYDQDCREMAPTHIATQCSCCLRNVCASGTHTENDEG